MRNLFLLLLLANLSLFGYTQLDSMSSGEGIRLREQIQPEKIRVLTAQQVAALAPDRAEAQPAICAEWGPFNETDRVRALADLEPLGIGRLLTQKPVEAGSSGYWVYVPPFNDRAAAQARVAELRAMGVRDVYVVDGAGPRFTVSLGVFRNADAAATHAADLVRRGVADARSGPRPQGAALTTLVMRDPPAAAINRVKELQAGYPGADLRIGSCERRP